jgi:hypothetical protein
MQPFGYIGIDFGTSNSHFAYCNREGDLTPQPILLGGKASMTTCVLWRRPAREERDIIAYGTEALETWLQYEAEERAASQFSFGFKPDLVKSERARRDTWAFLRKAREAVQRAGLPRPIGDGGMAVVIGVPAEIGDDHRRLTAEAGREAGFGDVECVEEPLGALAFHLHNGDITPAEARAGVVVVDFGGGTLDLALVNAEGLREPWGDPMLGGRLFDDLFYQWVRAQNDPLEIDEREELVVWQRECRDLKEAFSNRWRARGDSLSDFKGHIFVGDRKAWLRNASVREFEERARAYRPSPIVRKYFRGMERPSAGLILDRPINLFDWVQRTLTHGQVVGALRGKFAKVILTGGSCHWPFMTPLVAEALAVEEKDIILSQTPQTTIGSGLALFNVLKLKNEFRRAQLWDDKPGAAAKFRVAVAHRLDRFAEDTAEALVRVLLPPVEAVFRDWYDNGGSLKHVEERIDEICKQFEERGDAEPAIAPIRNALAGDLVRLLRDHLRQFLTDHEIPKDVFRYVPETAALPVSPNISKGTGDRIAAEVSGLAATVTAMAASLGTLVVAAVKIKVVILFAFVHPILALLAAAAVLLSFLGLMKGAQDALEARIKDYEFGSASLWVLHKVLWKSKFEERLSQGRADARAELQRKIRESTRTTLGTSSGPGDTVPSPENPIEEIAVQKFEGILALVVQDLGVLELVCHERP